MNIYDQTKLEDIAADVDILTDAERLERSMGNLISINSSLNYYTINIKYK